MGITERIFFRRIVRLFLICPLIRCIRCIAACSRSRSICRNHFLPLIACHHAPFFAILIFPVNPVCHALAASNCISFGCRFWVKISAVYKIDEIRICGYNRFLYNCHLKCCLHFHTFCITYRNHLFSCLAGVKSCKFTHICFQLLCCMILINCLKFQSFCLQFLFSHTIF